MKVIAFNGSGRKDGNTAILIKKTLQALEAEGIQTEFIQLAGEAIHGCKACQICREKKNKLCAQNDKVNEYLPKIWEADGLILGSPVYFGMMTPELKALIDRTGYVSMRNDGLLKRKVGAAIVVNRRAGALATFSAINNFFLINQMIVPGSSYWNIGMGREKGEVEKDEEGMRVMEGLGKNVAWLLKQLEAAKKNS